VNSTTFHHLVLAAAVALPGLGWADGVLLTGGDGAALAAAEATLLATGLWADGGIDQRPSGATPTPGELAPYDVVVLIGGTWDSPTGWGDVLSGFADGGGAVVLDAFATSPGARPTGAWASAGQSPVDDATAGPAAGPLDPSQTDPGHPATAGIAAASFTDLGQGLLTPSPSGAVLAADGANAPILVGTCQRRGFALGFGADDPGLDAGAAQLFAQTLLAATLDEFPSAALPGLLQVPEGSGLVLDGTGSTEGDLGPVAYAWDLDGDGQHDDAVGTTASFDANSLDGPTLAPVSLRLTDACGDISTATADVSVTNAPPTPSQMTLQPAALVGEPRGFAGTSTDPAGAADPRTWTWTWGDGSPDDVADDGESVEHTWTAPGTWSGSATALDDDGGTAVVLFSVVVTNPGPTLSAVLGPSAVDEGAAAAFSVAAADANGQPVELSWAWGDTTTDTGPALESVDHTWGDDGGFLVQVTATDGFGASATSVAAVAVANLPPTLSAPPNGNATEGSAYAATPAAADPGGVFDPLAFVLLAAPAGATIDPATGAVAWTPSFADSQAPPAAFVARVSDDEGATASAGWTVAVAFADADADGLPDTWESEHGLAVGADDSAADPDGDGLDNAAEWAGGTSPSISNAPSAALPLAPLAGATVGQTPTLQAGGATDPDGDSITYEFEVYGDGAATTLLASIAGIADGPTGWSVSPALPENAPAFWRARAADAHAPGPWSDLVEVAVDESNQPPSLPAPLEPSGGRVELRAPALVAGPSTDPEGDPIVVVARLFDADDALLVEVPLSPVAAGFEGAAPFPLAEDEPHSWTVEAVDARGASSGQSAATSFVVDATNAAPPPPAWLAPATDVVGARPELRLAVEPDAEGDELTLQFDVDSTPSFAAADLLDGGDAAVEGPTATPELAADLPENVDVWFRARVVDDGGAASAWVLTHAFVDETPEPPEVPRLITPADGERLDGPFVATWSRTDDPEGDPVSYTLRLRSGDEVLVEATDLTGASLSLDALDPGDYALSVEAADDAGATAGESPPHRVSVLPVAEPAADLSEGEGGCAVAPGAGWLLLWLPVALRLRA